MEGNFVIITYNGAWVLNSRAFFKTVDAAKADIAKLGGGHYLCIHKCFLDCLDLFEAAGNVEDSVEIYF
jgi:hypothetical protein